MSHHIVSNSGNITFVINNRSYIVAPNHANYDKIKSKLSASDSELLNLIDVPMAIQKKFSKTDNSVTVENGQVLYNGEVLHNSLTTRILSMISQNFDVTSMIKFLANVMKNPSYNSRNQLYDFLADTANLPITEDGCFLAYKSVDSDYLSKRVNNLTLLQGKLINDRIYNGIGETIECPRGEVDDNLNNQCSQGLHVGGLLYSGPGGTYNSPGDKVIIVCVNPQDAVSVPQDHACRKIRVCKYKVVGEYQKPLDQAPVYTNHAEPAIADAPNDYDLSSQNSENNDIKTYYDIGYFDGYNGNDFDDSYYSRISRESYDKGYTQGQIDAEKLEEEDDEDYDEDYYDDDDNDDDYDDCDCDNDNCLGKRPDGTNYYNGRGPDGKFKKKK